jgi:unsaturated rhamnogalacturonyl hydrolase
MSDRPLLRRVADEALRAHGAGELPRHWGDGILMLGLLETADALDEERYAQQARRWLDVQVAEGVNLAEGATWDWGALPLPALALYRRTREEQYLALARQVCEHIATKARRTADGAVVTHAGRPQLWVDSMYFTAPALVRTAAVTGEERYVEEALHEIEVHARHLLDTSTSLFRHMWDEESGQRSPCPWARGNAWAALATLEVLNALPHEHAQRAPLAEMLRRQMEAVLRLQDASGLWHTVLDRPDSYLETSCAAMFALAIVVGVRAGPPGGGWLPADMLASARRAWDGVRAQVTPEGRVTGVSAGTPPGEFETYQRVPLGSQTFATGLVLLAGIETDRRGGG